ncbi:MAG TPA: type II TA system antitoxin MqsA family protein [Gemmataceae bacterium]|nr:type II TA system antitoxin MqsA family protein [Gemmataceae bacterium]
MMSDKNSPAARNRPFPWRCVECRAKEVFPLLTDYTSTVKHDGRAYAVHIADLEIPTCRKCGEQVFTVGTDDRIVAALRTQLCLLTPEAMQRRRGELEMTQQELAEHLGVAKETISRWETGALIQSRAMDNLLRLYFESKEVRELLGRRFAKPPPPPVNRVWKRIKEESYSSVEFSLRRN